jgi:hypothetical protein
MNYLGTVGTTAEPYTPAPHFAKQADPEFRTNAVAEVDRARGVAARVSTGVGDTIFVFRVGE